MHRHVCGVQRLGQHTYTGAVCIDMRIDICIDMYISMRTGMCIGMWIDRCMDMCV